MIKPSFREILEAHHAFPGEYVFRVIGANLDDMPDLRQVLERRLRDAGVTEFRFVCQESRQGNYTAYRIYAQVDTVDQVVDLSSIFQRLAGVKAVL